MELLRVNRDPFLSGALYPDSGYWAAGAGVPGGDYGEISHWERFVNAYLAHIRDTVAPDRGCDDPTDPLGPCAPMIAHMLGTAAHGVGDEVWDWLFEPLVTDHGEIPDHPIVSQEPLRQVPPGSLITNIEYAMDMIAIVDHNLWLEIPRYIPEAEELERVYHALGRPDITAEGVMAGHNLETIVMGLERFGAAVDGDRVRQQMPWSASHYYSESGGVIDTAQAISGNLESLWRKLTGPGHPAPEIVAVHPEHGESGVPWDFIPAKTSPGPHSGGGELRIWAAISNSLDPASVAASFKLVGPGGAEVAPLGGFPKPGPYGAGDGTHSMLFYPAADLEPCTVYTAVVTTSLRDHAGASPRSTSSSLPTMRTSTASSARSMP
jgi:hypothetical protein